MSTIAPIQTSTGAAEAAPFTEAPGAAEHGLPAEQAVTVPSDHTVASPLANHTNHLEPKEVKKIEKSVNKEHKADAKVLKTAEKSSAAQTKAELKASKNELKAKKALDKAQKKELKYKKGLARQQEKYDKQVITLQKAQENVNIATQEHQRLVAVKSQTANELHATQQKVEQHEAQRQATLDETHAAAAVSA
ncbi:hypothetical protein P7C70_g2540, partial [Phenoliferia sp. Uapishka_3]